MDKGEGYRRGQPYSECPRCGFKVRLRSMRLEAGTSMRVCRDCFDPKPPHLKPPKYKPEGLPRPNAQPATEPVFVEDLGLAWGEDL